MQTPRFWREIDQRYNLTGVECANCKQVIFPVRSLCPKCRHLSAGKLTTKHLAGEGAIETFTLIHEPASGFQLQVPYVMAIIKLKEGPRVTAQVVDADPKTVKIGMKVKSVFRRISEEGPEGVIQYGYKFAPA